MPEIPPRYFFVDNLPCTLLPERVQQSAPHMSYESLTGFGDERESSTMTLFTVIASSVRLTGAGIWNHEAVRCPEGSGRCFHDAN